MHMSNCNPICILSKMLRFSKSFLQLKFIIIYYAYNELTKILNIFKVYIHNKRMCNIYNFIRI